MPTLLSPPSDWGSARGPGGAHAATAPRGGRPGRFAPGLTSGLLRLLIIGLVAASVAWGALAAWTVSQHASAADIVVSSSEPVSLDAQRMFQALSDADITVTTAFLRGPAEPSGPRQRYAADIRRAASELAAVRSTAGPGASPQVRASIAAVLRGLPLYTADVAQAQIYYSLGFELTGGSFLQVASEDMRVRLMPAAASIYRQENAALEAGSGRATGVWWVVAAIAATVAVGLVLGWAQWWLWRRTHRVVNYGLIAASAALVISGLWLITAFAVSRADLQRGVGNGSAPAEALARAGIAVQLARGDELLNLISHSGDTSFQQNFSALRSEIGPGQGTLMTDAASSGDAPAARQLAAAARAARAWYAASDQVFRLDVAAHYAAETQLVIGTWPTSSAVAFARVEASLNSAMADDQATFRSSATAGAGAFGGLEAGIIIAALVMSAGCAWGISRRLAEYR
jgi:hypothetical protein